MGNEKIKVINKEEFKKEVLGSKEPVLVDFYADWCGPCRMMGPVMEEVSKEYKVFKVNTDNEEELAAEYGIMSIPCVIAFKDGKEINRSIGYVSKDKIIDLCEFHLFFGFPICEYNCPYLSCNNCGLEPCESCKTEGQCPIHTKSNFKNDENKILNERTYKTYYTEFLNKNNKKEEKEEDQLNNGYQKISNNLTLQLSPKRE